MTFYKYLEQNPKFKTEYEKAQEIGLKSLYYRTEIIIFIIGFILGAIIF